MNVLFSVDVQQRRNKPNTRSRERVSSRSWVHSVLLLILLLGSTGNLFAQDAPIPIPGLEPIDPSIERAPKQIEVYFVPWDLHVVPKYYLDSLSSGSGFYPESSVSFKECVPGKLYDVKRAFERRQGTLFHDDKDVCCFSPESHILIVAASEENMKQITWGLQQMQYRPTLSLRGEIIVKEPKNQRSDRFVAGKWSLISASGVRATASGGNDTRRARLSYNWEFEPVVGEVGNTLNYNMLVNVQLDNGAPKTTEYKSATSGTLTFGKPHSMLIGTTADGEEIRVRITATIKSPRLPAALETPVKKQQLIECIRRQLAK